MPHRLFVAVRLPDEVSGDLEAFLEPRRDAGTELRWTRPEHWHVTLAFMEAVSDRAVEPLVERLTAAAARCPRFPLWLGGAGAFPHPYDARVLWLGVRGPEQDESPALARLARSARAAANAAGAAPHGAAFRAHVSLARSRRPVEATRWLRTLGTYVSAGFVVDRIELVASHLGEGPRRTPRHETLDTFALS
ncbi:MAG TPA: RNA 2',3'-cyclic phosphodiesterase [Candidatus Lustribacter sp.]|nr:RNA 2',3'-cyclic phosphodiesterase [Candidatus Lustribacter sp.]